MTSLFISYGSTDRRRAQEVAAWLRTLGHAAVFLDADPDNGIAPGRRWEAELYAALRRAEATIFLASDTSVTSQWCFAEVALSRSLGKPVIPARISGTARLGLVSDVQEVDLAGHGGLARLPTALRQAGVGADEHIAWDPSRPAFPGLAPFRFDDAPVFFGRDRETERLVQLLAPTLTRGPGRWVCVVGPSGSGKSSLLHAGLLPRLARQPDRWLILPPFAPGTQPTRRLARSLHSAITTHDGRATVDELDQELADRGSAALLHRLDRLAEAAGAPPSLLVVIDQLEELSTRTGKHERQSFLRLLTGALNEGSPLWVASSMRSEFLSTDPDRAELSEAVDDTLVIGPLSRGRLPDVIVRPARRIGLDFAPGLVERMVEDTSGGDALPLLAYALHELAAQVVSADRTTITIADYERVDGVIGALRSRADRLVEELARRYPPELIESTLLRLATVDDDGLPVRRRVRRSALGPDEQAVVDAFVDARLLVASSPADRGEFTGPTTTVEVAHEALLRQWEPLRKAIDKAHDSLRMRAELGREAADWEAGGRDPSYLLHGGRLDLFDEWAVLREVELDSLEHQFLDISRASARKQLNAARRTNRRLRRLAAGLAAVVLLALGATMFAVRKQADADSQADLALGRQLLAQASLLRGDQPDLALLLNVEALREAADDTGAEQARYALTDGLNRTFHRSALLDGHDGRVNAVRYSPDGRTLATSGEDGTIRLWNAVTGRSEGVLTDGSIETETGPLAFSPQGEVLAAGTGSTVLLWDPKTRLPRGSPLAGHTGEVYQIAFSPDGSLLATASEDHTVRLWDVATGGAHGTPLLGHGQGVFDVAFAPDGRTVVAGGWDPTVRSWDTATGKPAGALVGLGGPVASVVFSPDGSTLYATGDDGTVRSWDLHTGGERLVMAGHVGPVTTMALSSDGSLLVTGGEDETVRIWDASSGVPVGEPMTGHDDAIVEVAFLPGGRTVVSGSNDGDLRMWDLDTGQARGDPLSGHESWIVEIAVSPDGTTVASAGADGNARIWQIAATTPLGRIVSDTGRFNSVAIGPNDVLAAAGTDGRLLLSDLASGGRPVELVGHAGRVHGVAISSGGILASGGDDRTVRLWDAATREPVGFPLRTEAGVLDVAFSRDGSLLAAAGDDGVVTVWHTSDGTVRDRLSGHTGPVHSVAFGTGRLLTSGGNDGAVRVWDTVTGRPVGEPIATGDAVYDVALNPDGTLIAAAGADAMIRIWDVATGDPHGNPVTGFTSWINDIAFTPDGRTIASAADEGLQLWDVETGRARGVPLEAASRSLGVAIGPDGLVVASAGENATTVYDLHPDLLIMLGCEVANRDLSQAEWERFLPASLPRSAVCPQH